MTRRTNGRSVPQGRTMTESALRRWLVLVHAVLVEEQLADEIDAVVADLVAFGQHGFVGDLRQAVRRHRVQALLWRAQAAALTR